MRLGLLGQHFVLFKIASAILSGEAVTRPTFMLVVLASLNRQLNSSAPKGQKIKVKILGIKAALLLL
ncbi:hypothetical protein LPW36_13180 [Jinshanibacter sp. LJY008]|uniref:Uncharacterized protein n=1 Tax=Limnobaculum eriocheiris TaxID=2897391 RepID=A0A9X1SKX4_9GAMM|nr:hypothetical protein [Limnobaculum eriocheiris]MCD1126933.1 hypothetical protein [Limnobaculum eriocheiris]